MTEPKPAGITADRSERMLKIQWEDGGLSQIPFPLLRSACPCAQCRGGHEHMRDTPDQELFKLTLRDMRENELVEIQAVGNYGINIAWADGHKFGIYTWKYLWALGEGSPDAGEAAE